MLTGVADDRERGLGLTQAVLLPVQFAVTPNRQFEVIRQRIDDRHADAVQTAGDLVGRVIELTAGMEHRHDDFGGGNALLGVHIDGNTASVVGNRHRFVGVHRDDDLVAVPGQRLIDGVVHDLEHHVMQSAAIIGVTDIHSGALANRIEALQDFDFAGIVYVVLSHGASCCLARHSSSY